VLVLQKEIQFENDHQNSFSFENQFAGLQKKIVIINHSFCSPDGDFGVARLRGMGAIKGSG